MLYSLALLRSGAAPPAPPLEPLLAPAGAAAADLEQQQRQEPRQPQEQQQQPQGERQLLAAVQGAMAAGRMTPQQLAVCIWSASALPTRPPASWLQVRVRVLGRLCVRACVEKMPLPVLHTPCAHPAQPAGALRCPQPLSRPQPWSL